MNAFNEIMDTVSPVFRDGKESKQDALASLLAEAIVEVNPNKGIAADDRRAA